MKKLNIGSLGGTAAIVLALVLGACGDEDDNGNPDGGIYVDSGQPADIEIAGTWTSNFGGTETISRTEWDNGFVKQSVISFDNGQNMTVTQNPSTDMYFPNKFSKIVWTEINGNAFHYCTVDYGLDTAMAAETSTQTADATNPEAAGCGGFPWTKLTRQ